MFLFEINENSSLSLKQILGKLGYVKLASVGSGRGADESQIISKAIMRFQRKNQEYLEFLGLRIEGSKIISSSKSGLIPLKNALGNEVGANLIIQPMINWQTISSFASITKERSWLTIKQSWPVSKALDIELWYFAKPFLKEATSILKRPARGFKNKTSTDYFPQGRTNWVDFSINKSPYKQFSFINNTSVSTFNTLPHSLIIWCLSAIRKSILNINQVPKEILEDLSQIELILGNNIDMITPTRKNLDSLPRSGAWSGYQNLYDEVEHIAILSGVLNEDKKMGCAYSIQTEKLFEEFIIHMCQDFAKNNGFKFYKDSNDTSRIGLQASEHRNFMMLNSLRPDVVLLSNDILIVIDAKYKRHYDLASSSYNKEGEWFQEMRHDIHQVVGYSIFADRPKKIMLLTHPKLTDTSEYRVWTSTRNRNNLIGLLPMHYDEKIDIKSIKQRYQTNLTNIILYLK